MRRDHRQKGRKRGSPRQLAGDADEPSVLLDDPIDGGEAEPCPLPARLCREERLENVFQHIGSHAGPVIADAERHVPARMESRVRGAVGLVKRDVCRGDRHFADTVDRIAGVHGQVGEHLIELDRIDVHARHVVAGLPDEVDVLANQPPQHLQHARDGRVDVQHTRSGRLATGVPEQLAREVS